MSSFHGANAGATEGPDSFANGDDAEGSKSPAFSSGMHFTDHSTPAAGHGQWKLRAPRGHDRDHVPPRQTVG